MMGRKDGRYRVVRRYKNELPGEKLILWAVKIRLGKTGRNPACSSNENSSGDGGAK